MHKYIFEDSMHVHLYHYKNIEDIFMYEAIAYKVCKQDLWIVYFDISYYDDLLECQFSEYTFYDKYGYEIFHIHKKDLDEYEGNKMFTNWLIVNSII